MKSKALGMMILSGLLMGTVPSWQADIGLSTFAEASEKTVSAVVDSNTYQTAGNVYPTIGAALQGLKSQPADNYVLVVKPGVYREKIIVDIPNLTLQGENAANTTIVWNDAEGTPLRKGDVNGTKTTYTMECATTKITTVATNFQAVNITFANDFPTEAVRADKSMKAVQAFAITNEADKSSFYNCNFLGRQDTLYANAGRQYYKDCYIEGDVDFIFGQAEAAVFDNCEIKSLMRKVAEDDSAYSTGYITAPSTLAADKGFLFYRCHLTSDIETPHYALLGRPWHPSSETREVNSAAAFVKCQIDTPMKAKAWNSMKNKFGVFQPEDNRLFEYQNTGSGALTGGNRRQLSDEQARDYLPEKFLGDFKPVKRV